METNQAWEAWGRYWREFYAWAKRYRPRPFGSVRYSAECKAALVRQFGDGIKKYVHCRQEPEVMLQLYDLILNLNEENHIKDPLVRGFMTAWHMPPQPYN